MLPSILSSPLRSLCLLGVVISMSALGNVGVAYAQSPGQRGPVLFENVRIFDGSSEELSGPSNVLVEDGIIKTISAEDLTAEGAKVINGDGRVLMPGLIDAHWHTMLIGVTPFNALENVGFTHLVAGVEATATLMRGFTTVRDLGGPSFGLKRAIDLGLIPGPRIYPSGAMLTVTSGHADFRMLSDLPRRIGVLTPMEEVGMSMVVDSPDEVRMRVREQLMQGASQIKLTAGGGVASPFSPIDVSTFTYDELHAAVEAAENWGTYVGVHAYTSAAIQGAIRAGARVIEHGHLMDEETAKMIADNGVWLSIQPFDAHAAAELSEESHLRLQEVLTGTDRAYGFAKQYGIKTAFGTDILFSSELAKGQGAALVRLLRWYTAAEALKMATGTNGELLLLSGNRNPYPGRIGVVEVGALADLLLVDGNPLDDLNLVADPEKNFVIIMKDGVIFKDTTAQLQ